MSKLVVLPAPIAPMPEGATIVVAELVMLDGYHTLPTCLLRISTTNRKRFNLDALQRLAENVKEVGILQPILVRPVQPTQEAPQPFEIVAGERRFRSSILAELPEVPVIVRHLTDLQAAEIQLLENIQREDPHPLEEAEGYQLLMQNHGYDADQLAERVKKSRAYIYGRLKLCALSLDAREVFLDGDIPASTALLIARIPVPSLQKKALQEILKPQYGSEPLSYRAAAAHIAARYTLDLIDAPFDIKDGKLLAAAGNCVKCPKRTGNQLEVFSDAKSVDVCTDPDCFAEKKAAHYQRIVVVANKRGIPVLEGQEANTISQSAWCRDGEFVTANTHLSTFDRVTPSTGMSGYINELIEANALPAPAAYLKHSDGEVKPAYKRTDVQAALEKQGLCETQAAREVRLAEEAADPSKAAQLTKHQIAEQQRLKEWEVKREKARMMTAERVVLYRKLRAQISAKGASLEMLRELAKLLVRDDNYPDLPHDLIGDLYCFKLDENSVCAFIDKADGPTVHVLIMDLLLGEALSVDQYSVDDDPAPIHYALSALVTQEGVSASLGEVVAESIDVSELETADDVGAVVAAHIEHLADVARHIIDRAPHHLRNVEAAANELGYVYGQGGWKRQAADIDDAPQAEAPAVDATTSQQPEATARPTLGVKNRPAADLPQGGPAVTIKKNRGAALEAETAWPFPVGA
ncbi:MAG: ParB/RepB/Spo0J family partition protein [Burkholderiaceae bacterium]|nr:ParB/RepB/Spo0J family partition protein [Burkholderiaceae bacterium]